MSGIVKTPAESFSHGTRGRYVKGCRCEPCTIANRVYARERYRARRLKGDWNGLVSAEDARRHLLRLSRAGVGIRSVQAASDVSRTILVEVKQGRRTQIRRRTERRILAVDSTAIADGTIVDARRTWRLIDELLGEGFTKAELARRLGFKRPVLQLRTDRILARNALRVRRLYNQVNLGAR